MGILEEKVPAEELAKLEALGDRRVKDFVAEAIRLADP